MSASPCLHHRHAQGVTKIRNIRPGATMRAQTFLGATNSLDTCMRAAISGVGLAVLVCSLSACAQTIGDKFRGVMADIDGHCKREKRGPYLDSSDPEYHDKTPDTSCDILLLKPRDWRDAKFVNLAAHQFPI